MPTNRKYLTIGISVFAPFPSPRYDNKRDISAIVPLLVASY
jgi:hypothetical protein